MRSNDPNRTPLERAFERCLWNCRLLLVPAVIGSIIAAVVMILAGCADVVILVMKIPLMFEGVQGVKDFNREAILMAVAAIDIFLIATVLLIFAIGLYELFISEIDEIDEESRSAGALDVHSLDHLKEKLGKVIIMVMVVTLFKACMNMAIETALDMLLVAGGIVLAAVALYFSSSKAKKSE